MHEVCEPRLQALASHDEIDQRQVALGASVAGRKLAQAIEALDPLLRLVLDWQLGLHAASADVTTIATRLSLPVALVDRLIDEAVEELAWELLSSTWGSSSAAVAA